MKHHVVVSAALVVAGLAVPLGSASPVGRRAGRPAAVWITPVQPANLTAGTNSVVNFATTGRDTTINSGATPTPVRWSVVAGSIPTGMTGPQLPGRHRRQHHRHRGIAGTYRFTVQVTDQAGATDQENVTVTVTSA